MADIYKLSPSDFAYLYQDCKHDYWLKIKEGIYLPSMPMPGVFSAINSRVQGNMVGKNLKDFSDVLPDGIVETQEGWVESQVIPGTSVFIKGKYDLLVKNPDGTHSLVDLKISNPGADKVDTYGTQLSAYKYALENPKSGDKYEITKMALLILYPDKAKFENGASILDFPLNWFEVPIDEEGFLKFIKEVDLLLKGPRPKESATCQWCKYRNNFSSLSGEKESTQEDIPF